MNVSEKSYLQETFIKSNGIVTPKTHILMYLIAYKMTLKLIIPVQNKKVKSNRNFKKKNPGVISHVRVTFLSFFWTPVSREGGG